MKIKNENKNTKTQYIIKANPSSRGRQHYPENRISHAKTNDLPVKTEFYVKRQEIKNSTISKQFRYYEVWDMDFLFITIYYYYY